MSRFSLLCLVVLLAAVGTFIGAGLTGRNEATCAWGAIVMVALTGGVINFFRNPAEAVVSFILLLIVPIASVVLGHFGAFLVRAPGDFAGVIGVMSAVALVGLTLAEHSGVKQRWCLLAIILATAGTGLAIG